MSIKIRVISFFNLSRSFFEDFLFFAISQEIRIYVLNEIRFQVVLMARNL
jgi:hypothetical protein